MNTRISGMTKAVLLCMMFCLAPIVQAASATAKQPFDHTKTGFILKDVHTTLRCEQCHVEGIFKNTPKDCAGCHSLGSRVGATPKPGNHVQTTSACDTCHISPTSFLVKSFKHAGITSGCSSCHSGQSLGVLSKSATHFPTTLECVACHKNTNTFLSWKMDHTGITSTCSTCHGETRMLFSGVVNKPAAHIATNGAGCETCHSSFTTFSGATFDHSGPAIAGACNNCHRHQYSGVTSQSAVHFPTGALQCDTCHTAANTASYKSFLGGHYDHGGLPASSNNCSSCHSGQFSGARGKPTTHVTTSLQCDSCHTATNTGSFTSFLGATYTHLSPAGICATCHNGSTALGKSATHVVTTAACDICHTNTANYTTFGGAVYVHPTPPGICATCHNGTTAKGKSAAHLTTAAACDTCHTQTNTKGYLSFLGASYPHTSPIPACSTCHDGASHTALGKPATHIFTTKECSTCHTQANTGNFATFLGAKYIHPASPGVCATCHDGITATGRPSFHISIPTPLTCDSALCHTQTTTSNYTTFAGVFYTHNPTPATGSCTNTGCHSGTTAKVPSATHVAINGAPCDNCHTQTNTNGFTSFLGATYTHASPAGVCSTCHNNTTAKGKPATHVVTSAACDLCHTSATTVAFTNFVGGKYPHTSPLAACASCHTGTTVLGALGKPSTHVATSAACNTCHTNTANFTVWTGASYTHTSPPGACSTCHNGTTSAKPKPALHVLTFAECSTCHTQSNTGNFTSFLGATFTHSVPPGVCSTCHNGSTALGKSGSHILTTAACDTCHTQANTNNYKTFLGAVSHNPSMAGQCLTCHNGASAKGVSIGHIPVAGLSCDSGGCHKIYGGTVTTFAGAVMSHAVVTATRCDVCHNGSYTAQGMLGAQAKVTNHIPTTITGSLDCTTCHTTPAYTSATGWLTEKMNHNGAQGGGVPIFCVTCHLSGTTYLSSKIQKKSHEGASTAKDCSKSGCHKPLGSKGTAYSKWN